MARMSVPDIAMRLLPTLGAHSEPDGSGRGRHRSNLYLDGRPIRGSFASNAHSHAPGDKRWIRTGYCVCEGRLTKIPTGVCAFIVDDVGQISEIWGQKLKYYKFRENLHFALQFAHPTSYPGTRVPRFDKGSLVLVLSTSISTRVPGVPWCGGGAHSSTTTSKATQ
eukprot:1283488-Rhodomonas_salina.6